MVESMANSEILESRGLEEIHRQLLSRSSEGEQVVPDLVPPRGVVIVGESSGLSSRTKRELARLHSEEVEFGGVHYPSLSAAGKAAAGYPVNGWRFWRAAGAVSQ